MFKDFYKDSQFNELRDKMNIEDDVYAKLKKINSNKYKESISKYDIEMINNGYEINIDLDVLDYDDDKVILEIEKKQIILYMRDQYYPTVRKYKYHIAWCKTLEKRVRDKKIDRYVITRRRSDYFNINKVSLLTHKVIQTNVKVKMNICKDCLYKLNYKGYILANYKKRNKIADEFSLDNFLEKIEENSSININLETYATQAKNEYPKNWSEISRLFREKKNWICEECNKDFSENKGKLQVHHINSCKSDTRDENLKVLCNKCHDKEHGR